MLIQTLYRGAALAWNKLQDHVSKLRQEEEMPPFVWRSRGKHDILKELSLFNPLWSLTHFLMSCEQRADGREHLLVRVSRYPHATRTRLWARWRCWSLHKSVLSDGLILLHPHHLQIFWFIWTFQLTVLCFTVTRVKHDFTLYFNLCFVL